MCFFFEAAQLLCLLVQLHVRHQDVLLRLFAEAGVGPAVTGSFVGAPSADAAPAVQEDQARHQGHQGQARHQHHDQDGQVVAGGCKEAEESTESVSEGADGGTGCRGQGAN